MRILRALKSTPRFLLLAPAFGVLVALLVLAQSPGTAGADAGGDESFLDHICVHSRVSRSGPSSAAVLGTPPVNSRGS